MYIYVGVNTTFSKNYYSSEVIYSDDVIMTIFDLEIGPWYHNGIGSRERCMNINCIYLAAISNFQQRIWFFINGLLGIVHLQDEILRTS